MTNLFVETVFTSTINGITYQIYSQSVPDGAESRDDVIYYLFFLIERDQSYASEQIAQIEQAFNLTLLLVVIIVLAGFGVDLAGILCIALRTANSITRAIDVMTEYTNRLKMAPNVDGKRQIIAQISTDALFTETSKKYGNMKLAQKALIYRHKQEVARNELSRSNSRSLLEGQNVGEVSKQC